MGQADQHEIHRKLKELAAADAPKDLSLGAMCYRMASPPDTATYICPTCGNRTAYARKQTQRSDAPTEILIKLVIALIRDAVHSHASDIHIDPMHDRIWVRYRIDGKCVSRDSISLRLKNPLIGRIKIMADMDTAEKRLPQDGRIRMNIDKEMVDFRVSSLPGKHGESVVLHILHPDSLGIGTQDLGLTADSPQTVVDTTAEDEFLGTVEYSLPHWRKLLNESGATKHGVELDERMFCRHCSPTATDPCVSLTVRYADHHHRVEKISHEDIVMISEFFRGELKHDRDMRGEVPLKNEISRLQELLGVTLDSSGEGRR